VGGSATGVLITDSYLGPFGGEDTTRGIGYWRISEENNLEGTWRRANGWVFFDVSPFRPNAISASQLWSAASGHAGSPVMQENGPA